jgi:hypothetical protein
MSDARQAAPVARGAQSRLEDVCRAAATALSSDGAAAVLIGSAGAGLVTATDAVAATLETEQLTVGQGPSLSAFAMHAPVIMSELRGNEAQVRWPTFVGAIADVPVGRFLSLPMSVGGIRLGVLSVYSRQVGRLPRLLLPTALFAAETAALALLDAERETPGALPLSELGPTMDYRVHQATGMVMGQTGLSAHDALTRLRARAFSTDVPLQRLAADVILQRIRFDQEDA